MASFVEKRGMWSIRERVRQGSGFVYERSYSLLETKEEAEKTWISSFGTRAQEVLMTHLFQVHEVNGSRLLPNSEWDEIRDYLKNRAPVAQKLKRKRVELISSTVNQRSVKRKLAMAKALPAVDGSEKVKIQKKRENPMETVLFIKPDVKLWYTARFISFL
jgi:hypothetical protein